MPERIYLSPPDVGELELAFVSEALHSGWVAPVGPDLDAFESEIAARVGVAQGVAVISGTAGLHLAMLGLGVGPGQVVVVPTLTFVATANAVIYSGAEPVFVDSEAGTGNIDAAALDDALSNLRAEGREIGAVVCVDALGTCADYSAVLGVCDAFDVAVVEDATGALGSMHNGKPAGSFGRISVLSFNGNKIMTTSGGGMLLSDDGAMLERCRYLATQARQPVVHYEHTEVGFNYRLSNVLAALGRAQLRRLDEMIGRRQRLRGCYRELFARTGGVRLLAGDDTESNCWLTTIVVDPSRAGWHAHELQAYLSGHDIESRPLWKPMHLQPLFRHARCVATGVAEGLFETSLSLPSGSSLDDAQVTRVVETIGRFLERR